MHERHVHEHPLRERVVHPNLVPVFGDDVEGQRRGDLVPSKRLRGSAEGKHRIAEAFVLSRRGGGDFKLPASGLCLSYGARVHPFPTIATKK